MSTEKCFVGKVARDQPDAMVREMFYVSRNVTVLSLTNVPTQFWPWNWPFTSKSNEAKWGWNPSNTFFDQLEFDLGLWCALKGTLKLERFFIRTRVGKGTSLGTWLLLTIMILMNSRDRLSKDRGACAQIIWIWEHTKYMAPWLKCWFRLEIALIACENSKQSSAALVISQQNASLIIFIYENRNLAWPHRTHDGSIYLF